MTTPTITPTVADNTQASPPTTGEMLRQTFLRPYLLLSGIVPTALYYIIQANGDPITAALVAGGWTLAVTLGYWLLERRINALALMGFTVTAITLSLTLISQDENIYLAEEAISRVMFGVLFLGSLLLPRSLMQILSEEISPPSMFDAIPAALRRSVYYRRMYDIVTAVWGMGSLLFAGVLVYAQFNLPLETFLVLRSTGWRGFNFLILASLFWFPRYYWSRTYSLWREDETGGNDDTAAPPMPAE